MSFLLQSEIVICKPDALRGPDSAVGRLRATSFLLALASACDQKYFYLVPNAMRPAAESAAMQIYERSLDEASFKGAVVDSRLAARRLRKTASKLRHNAVVSTLSTLQQALSALGFKVEVTIRHICTAIDISAIYFNSGKLTEQTRHDLLDYLLGNEIDIWLLSSNQNPCTLQWWKTYARHLLKKRNLLDRGHLTKNLIHVCENEDKAYLLSSFFGPTS